MILDDRLEFADATALSTSATADAIFGDVIDTNPNGSGNTLTDIGTGEPLYLVIQVTTALTSATSLRIRLYSDSTANLATSPTTHWDSGAVAIATWNAAVTPGGAAYVVALPPTKTYEKYVGLWQNVVGTLGAGALNAFLTRDPTRWAAYTDNDPGTV